MIHLDAEVLYVFKLSLRAISGSVAISIYDLEIAELVPSEARNLRVCFGFASQPFHSSQ